MSRTPHSPFLPLAAAATGRLPPGAAFPVPGLAGVPRHPAVQALHPAAGAETGQVAGAVRRRRRTHCGPLPVSGRLPIHTGHTVIAI